VAVAGSGPLARRGISRPHPSTRRCRQGCAYSNSEVPAFGLHRYRIAAPAVREVSSTAPADAAPDASRQGRQAEERNWPAAARNAAGVPRPRARRSEPARRAGRPLPASSAPRGGSQLRVGRVRLVRRSGTPKRPPRPLQPFDQTSLPDKFSALKRLESFIRRAIGSPRPTVRVLIGGERLYGAWVTVTSRPDLSLRQLTTSLPGVIFRTTVRLASMTSPLEPARINVTLDRPVETAQ
jgi:hypothetical protein